MEVEAHDDGSDVGVADELDELVGSWEAKQGDGVAGREVDEEAEDVSMSERLDAVGWGWVRVCCPLGMGRKC